MTIDVTPSGEVVLRLAGHWTLGEGLADTRPATEAVSASTPRVRFEDAGIEAWDTSLVTFLAAVVDACTAHGVELDTSSLPAGAGGLVRLARAVPEKDTGSGDARPGLLTRIGLRSLEVRSASVEALAFVGDAALSVGRLLSGRARFRFSDFAVHVQACGAQALPIVTLISFLVGLILAFVGAVQLRQFGAQIFVANLVGLGMARDMAGMMTGIIMAGRTGAAYAAELGSMTVNEEIDALETVGISPMDFLVLPRMLALVLMTPLLCIYADLVGIAGGLLVGVTILDLAPTEYITQTRGAITLTDFSAGLAKSAVYGAIVALAGCLRGMQCGRSSASVGLAATSAVVTGMIWIVVAAAVLTVVYDAVGI